MDPLEDDHELCEQEAARLREKLVKIREVAEDSEPSYLSGFILGYVRREGV